MFNKLPSLMITQERSRTQCNESGFSFINCMRNAELFQKGFKPPHQYSNGTTLVGVIYGDGVILGTDTRTTTGHLVGLQNAAKIYRLHQFIYAGGAGTANDVKQTANMAGSQMELISMNTNRRRPPVCCANRIIRQYLYSYRTAVNANFIIAGVDLGGPQLFCTHCDGSSDKVPYAALGSGLLPAMAVIESRWQPTLGECYARDLVCDAVAAGIETDMFSGSSVDLCILRRDFTLQMLNQPVYVKRVRTQRPFGFPLATVPIGVLSFQLGDKRVFPISLHPSGRNLLHRRSSSNFPLQWSNSTKSIKDQQENEANIACRVDLQGNVNYDPPAESEDHQDRAAASSLGTDADVDVEVPLLEVGKNQQAEVHQDAEGNGLSCLCEANQQINEDNGSLREAEEHLQSTNTDRQSPEAEAHQLEAEADQGDNGPPSKKIKFDN